MGLPETLSPLRQRGFLVAASCAALFVAIDYLSAAFLPLNLASYPVGIALGWLIIAVAALVAVERVFLAELGSRDTVRMRTRIFRYSLSVGIGLVAMGNLVGVSGYLDAHRVTFGFLTVGYLVIAVSLLAYGLASTSNSGQARGVREKALRLSAIGFAVIAGGDLGMLVITPSTGTALALIEIRSTGIAVIGTVLLWVAARRPARRGLVVLVGIGVEAIAVGSALLGLSYLARFLWPLPPLMAMGTGYLMIAGAAAYSAFTTSHRVPSTPPVVMDRREPLWAR